MLDQDVLLNSHEAGVGGLESEFLHRFVSFIKSTYECVTKGKDPKEALKRTAIATLKGGVRSYGIASGGSLLGGVMQNNANKVIQSLGKSSAPAMIVGLLWQMLRYSLAIFLERLMRWSFANNLGEPTPVF